MKSIINEPDWVLHLPDNNAPTVMHIISMAFIQREIPPPAITLHTQSI